MIIFVAFLFILFVLSLIPQPEKEQDEEKSELEKIIEQINSVSVKVKENKDSLVENVDAEVGSEDNIQDKLEKLNKIKESVDGLHSDAEKDMKKMGKKDSKKAFPLLQPERSLILGKTLFSIKRWFYLRKLRKQYKILTKNSSK